VSALKSPNTILKSLFSRNWKNIYESLKIFMMLFVRMLVLLMLSCYIIYTYLEFLFGTNWVWEAIKVLERFVLLLFSFTLVFYALISVKPLKVKLKHRKIKWKCIDSAFKSRYGVSILVFSIIMGFITALFCIARAVRITRAGLTPMDCR